MAKNEKEFAFTQPQLAWIVTGLQATVNDLDGLAKKCRASGQNDAADLVMKDQKMAKDLLDDLKLELTY